jgi:hypothetical protein
VIWFFVVVVVLLAAAAFIQPARRRRHAEDGIALVELLVLGATAMIAAAVLASIAAMAVQIYA